jgi:hypothetical protein
LSRVAHICVLQAQVCNKRSTGGLAVVVPRPAILVDHRGKEGDIDGRRGLEAIAHDDNNCRVGRNVPRTL